MNKTKERYQLMKQVYYYLVSKRMGFCFLPSGELIDIKTAENYIANNHFAEYDKEV